MGRKKLYSDEEREERVLQQKKAYYQRNKEKIAEKYKLWRLKKLGIIQEDEEQTQTKPLRKVIEEWNEQLYQHMQENLPQWLEMALNKQIELNIQFINQYEQEKPRI